MGILSGLIYNIDFCNLIVRPYLPGSMAFLSVCLAKYLSCPLTKIVMCYSGGIAVSAFMLATAGIIEVNISKKNRDGQEEATIVMATMGITTIHLATYYAGVLLLKAIVIPIAINLAQ